MALTPPQIRRVSDSQEIALVAAQTIVQIAQDTIKRHDRLTIALAGGSTPKGLYHLLASDAFRSQIPWEKIHIFWGDERHVPPDHPESNYRMAQETLLSQIPLPPHHIHRIHSELPNASEAAEQYEQEIKECFQVKSQEIPRFDVILLGMGPDGHTASLFPGTAAVHETERFVVAPWVEKFKTYRMTLTPPVLNEASQIIFLVSGSDKSETLQEVLEGDFQPDTHPVQIVRPIQGEVLWLIDEAASGSLSN